METVIQGRLGGGRGGWKIYDVDSGVMNGEKMRWKIYCISLSRLIDML